jgi:2'-5' RNA ligase
MTYWVSIPLPRILPRITEWIQKNLSEKDLVLDDKKIFPARMQNNPHITVLMNLPRAVDEGLVKLVSTFLSSSSSSGGERKEMKVSLGKINAFPLQTKPSEQTKSASEQSEEKEGEEKKEYKYRVLYVEIIDKDKSLLSLQEAIGNYYATSFDTSEDGKVKIGEKVCWHHSEYNPHITLAFVNEGVAEKFIDSPLIPDDEDDADKNREIIIKEIKVGMFGDFDEKLYTPIHIRFSN